MTQLFLASSSPRRRLLLEEAGIPFEWSSPGIDDSPLEPGEVTPGQWVASLAFLKASAGIDKLPSADPLAGWVVLGADTLVVKDGGLIGQPRDAEHAAAIVRLLRNGSHRVLTGVAIIEMRGGERHLFVDEASVTVGGVTDRQIADYVDSGGWRGKAGGYNLHERLADGWPITFEGDPTTIVGLPMRRLVPVLERLGVGARDIGAAV